MITHLTDEQLRRFCSREMTGDELLDADAHLAVCEECRLRAWNMAHGPERAQRLAASALPECDSTRATATDSHAHGVPRPGAEDWRRRRGLGWGLATMGMIVIYATVLMWPTTTRSDGMMFHMTPPTGVTLSDGEPVGISCAGFDKGRAFVLFRYATVDHRGLVPDLQVPYGTCVVSVVREDPDASPRRLFAALSDLRSGRNVVRLIAGDNKQTEAVALARLPRKARGVSPIEGVLLGASMNFFDDIKVATPSKVIFEERFNRPDGTARIPGLETQWHGKGAFVSRSVGLPDTRDGVWVNLAYPNFNRADRIPLRPAEIPRGEPLVIESRVLVTDPRAGIEIALSKPFQHATGAAQDAPMLFRFELGMMTVHGPRKVGTFEPLRWYHVRIECDLAAHTYNVIVDGSPLAVGVRMQASQRPGVGYDFDGVVFGGQWHGNVD